jgi:chemosensory pili system protein ChpC
LKMAALPQPPPVLRSFLIPFQGGHVLLPHSSLVEVLLFTTAVKIENAPPWVMGTVLLRARTVPLVSLERLIDGAEAGPETYTRIVLVNTLGTDPRLPYFGLPGTDAPRLLNLEREDITLDETPAAPITGVLCRVRVKDQPAIILDIDALETVLAPFMRDYD